MTAFSPFLRAISTLRNILNTQRPACYSLSVFLLEKKFDTNDDLIIALQKFNSTDNLPLGQSPFV